MKSRQRRSFSAEMKARIALEAIKGQKTIQEIASHYGVHPARLRTGSTKRFKEVRGHLMRARERTGLGWKRWSRPWLYEKLGLYNDYRLHRPWSPPKVQPAE